MPVTVKMFSEFRDEIKYLIGSKFLEMQAWMVEESAKTHNILINFEQRMNDGFTKVDERFVQIHERFPKVDERFVQIDQRFEKVDQRFNQMDLRFDSLETSVLECRASADNDRRTKGAKSDSSRCVHSCIR